MNNKANAKKDVAMPNIAFRIMSGIFWIMDLFKPVAKNIDEFNIVEGSTIMDYGCGPGRHIKRAAELVGTSGLVYAVDIHELAISSVQEIIEKYTLKNVATVLSDGSNIDLDDDSLDLIYALDMFHMVKNPDILLKELNRLSKKTGVLFLEDGHQPRSLARKKILDSGLWEIVNEQKKYVKCSPLHK